MAVAIIAAGEDVNEDDWDESAAGALPTESIRLRSRVAAVCDAVGEFIEYWGFKSVQGRIWAYLALSRVARSQREIGGALGISKALVSSTISELEGLGLVLAVEKRRSSPYVASINVWPVITDVLRTREWMLVEGARVAAEALVEELESEKSAGASGFDETRARFLLTFTTLAQGMLKALLALKQGGGKKTSLIDTLLKAARFLTEGK